MASRTSKTVSNNPLESIGMRASSKAGSTAAEKPVTAKRKRPVVAADKATDSVAPVAFKGSKASPKKANAKAPQELNDSQLEDSTESAQVSLVSAADTAQGSYSEIVTAEDIFAEEYKASSSVVVLPKSTTSADTISNIFVTHTVKSWSQWAVVAGLVPVPIADTVAISGVQISMIHELCKHYKVEFKKEAALAVVSGLIVGKFTTTFGNIAGNIFLNNIPVIGTVMKYTTQPILSYATTYALGHVFIRHFESKGTMVDLDSKRLASYFKEQYAKGRKLFKAEFKGAATQ